MCVLIVLDIFRKEKPTTNQERSERMRKAWETRRQNAGQTQQPKARKVIPDVAEAAWRQHPVCCCGCGAELVKKGPKTQSLFAVGHDARLHGMMRRGEPIPVPAQIMAAYIKFLE